MATSADVAMVAIRRLTGTFPGDGTAVAGAMADGTAPDGTAPDGAAADGSAGAG